MLLEEEGQRAVRLGLSVVWRAGGKVYTGQIRDLSGQTAWFEGEDGKGESITGRPPFNELALVKQEEASTTSSGSSSGS